MGHSGDEVFLLILRVWFKTLNCGIGLYFQEAVSTECCNSR